MAPGSVELAVVDPDIAAELRTILAGPPRPAVAAIGGGLTLRLDGRQLTAEHADSGSQVFTVDLGAVTGVAASGHVPTSTMARAHTDGIVAVHGRTAVGLDLDGRVRWVRPTGVAEADLLVATPDHVVVAGRRLGSATVVQLAVLEPDHGTLRFERDVAAVVGVEEFSAIVRDQGADRALRSIGLWDGSVRWELLDGDGPTASPQDRDAGG